MARRFNTAAIRSAPAGASAVNATPTHASEWDSETSGNLLRTFPLSRLPGALELGERVEFPAGELALVKAAHSGGLIAGVLITAGGDSYDSAPTVTFSGGGGSGAAGTAVLSGDSVARIEMTNPGSGYTSAPTVTFSGGGSGTGAAGTALLALAETEALAAKYLEGETAAALWYKLHDGDPGAAGDQNEIDIPRFTQAETNWTAGT